MNCTIFRNTIDTTPYPITVDKALQRIKEGKSKNYIEELRSQLDKDRQTELKKNLPGVSFSGTFSIRNDQSLLKHSGFIILDFDKIPNLLERKKELCSNEYIYACWISPSNNGLKALVRIANGDKHIEHFEALREVFHDADKSGRNVSRLCYESYDPDLYLNENSSVFKKVKVCEKVEQKITNTDELDTFNKILKWLSNKGDAFREGERNNFIYKLASACCRFGLDEEATVKLCKSNFDIGSGFRESECEQCVRSAYKTNRSHFRSAKFENEILVDKVSRYEVKVTEEMMDGSIKAKDVIFGEDVIEEVIGIFQNGYAAVNGIGVHDIDNLYKLKRGEITLLSGYGNYGKSTFMAWKLLMRAILYGEKFAFFSPEDNAAEFYHNLTEMLLGCDCTPDNMLKPNLEEYQHAYSFISKHMFYVYPKTIAPTPEYIKERFLELIIKEKIDGVMIDPFNQLTNDYNGSRGRTDKYLETFLSDCSRFSHQNNIYLLIVAHPVKMKKDENGNYPCPDVFDIADGAMWNNKMDNIVIFDRPNHQKDPNSSVCEFHSKKIRRQKVVGRKGTAKFNFRRISRRYVFDKIENGVVKQYDPMAEAIKTSNFYKPVETFCPF